MNLRRCLVIPFVTLSVLFVLFVPGFSQAKEDKPVSFSGVIEGVHEGFKYIVINERRVVVSPETRILDERGNILNVNALKPRLNVTIEAIRMSDRLMAKKIVIKIAKRKP